MKKSKQIFFFAAPADIHPIIELFEKGEFVDYFQTGMFDCMPTPKLNSILEYENLGHVSNGDWNQNESFLILEKEKRMCVREIPQKAGGFKFAVDQLQNSESVVLKPGGIFKPGVLVAGSLGTVHINTFSTRVFSHLQSLIKSEFVKVGTFYVGKNAKERLESKWRLVTNEKSPKEYDLLLP